MKSLVLLALILIVALDCSSQNRANAQHGKSKSPTGYIPEEPYYPGGTDSLFQYVANNVRYPDSINHLNISGKVYVSFIVDTLGNVKNVTLLKGMNKAINDEVMRVISNTKWIPAIINGVKTAITIALPVVVNTGEQKE